MSQDDFTKLLFNEALQTGLQNKDVDGLAELLGPIQVGIRANLQELGVHTPDVYMSMPRFESLLNQVKTSGLDRDVDALIVFKHVSIWLLTDYHLKGFAKALLEKYAPKPKIDDDVIIVDGAAGGPVVIGVDAQKARDNYVKALDKATEALCEKKAIAKRLEAKREELRLIEVEYANAVRKHSRAEQEEADTARELKRCRNT